MQEGPIGRQAHSHSGKYWPELKEMMRLWEGQGISAPKCKLKPWAPVRSLMSKVRQRGGKGRTRGNDRGSGGPEGEEK